VTDAGHELRTPLTSLRLNVEMLAADGAMPEAERQQVLERVVAQVAELGDLVANVTELARGDLAASAPGDVSLDEVVAAALEGAQRDWPRTVFVADLEPCQVFGSAERLQIAVRNLLDNAAKFGPPDGPVEVSLLGGELTVRDHGPGIAPGDRALVFDRFYRAPAARAVPGSGLGLSITRQVTESHGGTVRAEAAPGGGTVIRLIVPEIPARPQTTDDAVTAPAAEPEHATEPGHATEPEHATEPGHAAQPEYLSHR
jgi:two-component system sensor histidine kinase MprB